MAYDLVSPETLEAIVAFMRAHGHWSLPILFGIMVLEGILATTFIFSATLMTLAAGAMVQAGALGLASAFATIVAGLWLGDWINYAIGRRGEAWARTTPFVRRRLDLLQKAERLIVRHGAAAIFLSRFMGPLRPFVTMLAGAAGMPARPFHLATLAATGLSTAGLLYAGMGGVELVSRLRP